MEAQAERAPGWVGRPDQVGRPGGGPSWPVLSPGGCPVGPDVGLRGIAGSYVG